MGQRLIPLFSFFLKKACPTLLIPVSFDISAEMVHKRSQITFEPPSPIRHWAGCLSGGVRAGFEEHVYELRDV